MLWTCSLVTEFHNTVLWGTKQSLKEAGFRLNLAVALGHEVKPDAMQGNASRMGHKGVIESICMLHDWGRKWYKQCGLDMFGQQVCWDFGPRVFTLTNVLFKNISEVEKYYPSNRVGHMNLGFDSGELQ